MGDRLDLCIFFVIHYPAARQLGFTPQQRAGERKSDPLEICRKEKLLES